MFRKRILIALLRDFKKTGFGGVFLHPRYGMMTEYLSDEWFELVKYSRDVAKKLELELWIYDENSYPSGFAGGHVNEQMPESYNQGVMLVPSEMNTLSLDDNQRIKYVFKYADGNWLNITATASTGKWFIRPVYGFFFAGFFSISLVWWLFLCRFAR